MYKRKPLEELTLKDNFMFCAVMMQPENCGPLLELILGKKIGRLAVDQEKCLIYNPNYKSVRLDVFAKEEDGAHFDIEMQVVEPADLNRRSRYYHSQMDMEALDTGLDYDKLPECFVIFICDFDPFGEGKYCYFMQKYCRETGKPVNDGSFTIFLNSCGRNGGEVSKRLADLLDFIHSEYSKEQTPSEDAYIRQLQNSIKKVKDSREMGIRYKQYQEMLSDERRKGLEEGLEKGRNALKNTIIRLLSSKSSITDALRYKICEEKDMEMLERWSDYAISSANIEEFEEKIKNDRC